MEPFTLAVVIVLGWAVRRAAEDGIAFLRGQEAPRITRKRATLQIERDHTAATGQPSRRQIWTGVLHALAALFQAGAGRAAQRIASPPAERPALDYLRRLWRDAWRDAADRHEIVREARRRAVDEGRTGWRYPPRENPDDTVYAEVVENGARPMCSSCAAVAVHAVGEQCPICRWGPPRPPRYPCAAGCCVEQVDHPGRRCGRCSTSGDAAFGDPMYQCAGCDEEMVDVPTRLGPECARRAAAPIAPSAAEPVESVVHESNHFRLPVGPPDGPCGLGCERLRPADRCVRCSPEQDADDPEPLADAESEPADDPVGEDAAADVAPDADTPPYGIPAVVDDEAIPAQSSEPAQDTDAATEGDPDMAENARRAHQEQLEQAAAAAAEDAATARRLAAAAAERGDNGRAIELEQEADQHSNRATDLYRQAADIRQSAPAPNNGASTNNAGGTTMPEPTTVIDGDVHDPSHAHAHATACATFVSDVGQQAEVCANNMAALGLGARAVGEMRGMEDDAAEFLGAAASAAGVFASHMNDQANIADDEDLAGTVADTYLGGERRA